jgi:hypothetical protein
MHQLLSLFNLFGQAETFCKPCVAEKKNCKKATKNKLCQAQLFKIVRKQQGEESSVKIFSKKFCSSPFWQLVLV